MTVEQVNERIQNGGALDMRQLIYLLKNNRTIRRQAEMALRRESKKAAGEVVQYVDGLINGLSEEHAKLIRALYVEGLSWLHAEQRVCMTRNTIGRNRKEALQEMLHIANGTLKEPA